MRAIRQTIILLAMSVMGTSCVSDAAHTTVTDPDAMLKQARAEQAAAREAYAAAVRETMSEESGERWLDPADKAVYDQFEQTVDMSAMRPEMPFGEAIQAIRNSVQPPLNIVVLWRELLDSTEIKPSTPINMDGLPRVKLGTALQSLLNALSNPQLGIQLDYTIDQGVITIAANESLPAKPMTSHVHEIPAVLRATGRTDELALLIQTIEPDSWFELSEEGEGMVVPGGDATLVVWQSRDVHKKIHDVLHAMAEQSPVVMPIDAPPETLKEQMQFLISWRETLQKDVARLEEHQAQREIENRPRRDGIRQMQAVVSDLEMLKANIAGGEGGQVIARLEEIINRAKGSLAAINQAMSEGRPRGFDSMSPSSTLTSAYFDLPFGETSAISAQLMAKQAQLNEVSRKIAIIHRALLGQTIFDPQVRRIHAAAKRLYLADSRVQELETQLASAPSGNSKGE